MARIFIVSLLVMLVNAVDPSCRKNTMEEELRRAQEAGAKYLERKRMEAESDMNSVRGSSMLQVGTRTGQTSYEQGFSAKGKVVKRTIVQASQGSNSKIQFRPPVFNPFKPDPALVNPKP
mmetsp:Transcript_44482/g.102821  ORF Transcript_44482/g.102821 Transcript_44482/m.102821 type:complete len:120 (-) Transcript_44482:97-456(-)